MEKSSPTFILIAFLGFMLVESRLPNRVTTATTTITTTTPSTTPSCSCGGEQVPSCNQSVCDACPTCTFPTANVTADDIAYSSPHIVHLLQNNSIAEEVTNQCFTYLQLFPGVFLYISTNQLENGIVSANFFFFYDTPQGQGSFWIVGLVGVSPFTPSIAVQNVVEVSCPGCSILYSVYTVTTAEGCPPVTGFDPLVVFGPSTQPADCCISQALTGLNPYSGNETFLTFAKTKPIPCVADIYGIPVINSDSIINNPEIQALSFPSLTPY